MTDREVSCIPPVVRAIMRQVRMKVGWQSASVSWAILTSGDFAGKQCGKILDRVYGLLGLLSKDDAGIQVDYSKTAEQLLIHGLYKYNLSDKGRFWNADWPQKNYPSMMQPALQIHSWHKKLDRLIMIRMR